MNKYLQQFQEFIRSNANGGALIILCVIASLFIANTNLNHGFNNVLSSAIGPYNVKDWINDGLMAIFFMLVGLEIKDEVLTGRLSDMQSATLPVFAAFGGMVVPAIIYYTINYNTSAASGWGIPMATDIAFVVAIINIIKSKVPLSLQVFIKALAIVDDLGAILVIAVFYSSTLNVTYLLLAAGIFIFQLLLNKLNVRYLAAYIISGIALWYCIHHSGIHATLAGVLTAISIPGKVKTEQPLKRLIHLMENPVNLLIVPLFALANSNITFTNGSLNNGFIGSLSMGIFFGLFLGKPVGVTLFSWLAVKLKLSRLAVNVKWAQVWGLGQLAGIGFTMSIFMSLLSFGDPEHQNLAKIAILLTSVLAAATGYFILKAVKRVSP